MPQQQFPLHGSNNRSTRDCELVQIHEVIEVFFVHLPPLAIWDSIKTLGTALHYVHQPLPQWWRGLRLHKPSLLRSIKTNSVTKSNGL